MTGEVLLWRACRVRDMRLYRFSILSKHQCLPTSSKKSSCFPRRIFRDTGFQDLQMRLETSFREEIRVCALLPQYRKMCQFQNFPLEQVSPYADSGFNEHQKETMRLHILGSSFMERTSTACHIRSCFAAGNDGEISMQTITAHKAASHPNIWLRYGPTLLVVIVFIASRYFKLGGMLKWRCIYSAWQYFKFGGVVMYRCFFSAWR